MRQSCNEEWTKGNEVANSHQGKNDHVCMYFQLTNVITFSVMENAEVFTCKMCKSNYVSKARLEEHIQDKHTTKGGWMHCQLCEYKFRKATKLTEHMVACHDQGGVTKNLTVAEEFNCSLCSFSTNT